MDDCFIYELSMMLSWIARSEARRGNEVKWDHEARSAGWTAIPSSPWVPLLSCLNPIIAWIESISSLKFACKGHISRTGAVAKHALYNSLHVFRGNVMQTKLLRRHNQNGVTMFALKHAYKCRYITRTLFCKSVVFMCVLSRYKICWCNSWILNIYARNTVWWLRNSVSVIPKQIKLFIFFPLYNCV